MRTIVSFIALFILLSFPSPGTAGSTDGAEMINVAHDLEYRSLLTLKAMLEASPGKQTAEETFLFHLLNFSGSAKRFYQFLSWNPTERENSKILLDLLNRQGQNTGAALYNVEVPEKIRAGWGDCLTALSLLNRYFEEEGAEEEVGEREESPPQETAEESLEEELVIEITHSDFHGNIFTPYLRIEGYFKGTNLKSGSLRIENESGEVLLDEEDGFPEIDEYYKEHGRASHASIRFSRRIRNNDLASGTNRITITLRDMNDEYNKKVLEIQKKKLHF